MKFNWIKLNLSCAELSDYAEQKNGLLSNVQEILPLHKKIIWCIGINHYSTFSAQLQMHITHTCVSEKYKNSLLLTFPKMVV